MSYHGSLPAASATGDLVRLLPNAGTINPPRPDSPCFTSLQKVTAHHRPPSFRSTALPVPNLNHPIQHILAFPVSVLLVIRARNPHGPGDPIDDHVIGMRHRLGQL